MIKKNKNIDPRVKDLIINAAYGSANLSEKLKAKRLIKRNPELKELYQNYKLTADSVHALEKERIPDSVLSKTERFVDVNLHKKESSFFNDLVSIFYAKPQLTFIGTAIVMALLVFSIFMKNNDSVDFKSSQYTKAEVEMANRQAKQTLMLVSQILNSTKTAVTEDIIPNHVVKPINESFNYVNDLLKKGDI